MDLKELVVYQPGSEVDLGQGLKGMVNQVIIAAGDHVRYEVAWWAGNDRKCEWLEQHEVMPSGTTGVLRIGFKEQGGE